MPDWLIVIIIIAAFAAVVYFGRKIKHAAMIERDPIAERQQKMINTLTTDRALDNGIRLLSRQPLAPQFIEAAQAAFGMCLIAANKKGWSKVPDPSKVIFLVFPSVRDYLDGSYSPVFKAWIMKGDFYWGGQYDKGVDPEDPENVDLHYIYAAEQVLSYEPAAVGIIAEYRQDWQQCRNAMYFFYEHWLYQINASAEHAAGKATHADGTGHPIITEMQDEVNAPWPDSTL